MKVYRDSLLKCNNPGGDWHPGWGDNPNDIDEGTTNFPGSPSSLVASDFRRSDRSDLVSMAQGNMNHQAADLVNEMKQNCEWDLCGPCFCCRPENRPCSRALFMQSCYHHSISNLRISSYIKSQCRLGRFPGRRDVFVF